MRNITYILIGMVSMFSLAQVSELRTIQHDGNNRQFFLYVPASYNQDNATPVMFNFHGGGGTASAHLNYTSDMRNLAESENFILVYPQASPDPSSNVNSWIDKAGSNKNDIYFIEAIFNNLNSIYNIDDSRVYACGYSEGAIFTYELACRLSNVITGIATVAGSMLTDYYRGELGFSNCSPSHPTPVLLMLGTNDNNYHGLYNGLQPYYMSVNDMTTYWSNYNSTDPNPIVTQLANTNTFDGSTVEKRLWQNGTGGVEVLEMKIVGGGHYWPGNSGNMDIDGNEEIWNFLSKFDKNGLISSLSISEVAAPIKIYPNPFDEYLNIENLKNGILFFDITGKQIEISIKNNTIDTSMLNHGIYFLTTTGNGKNVFKLIK